MNTWKPLEHEIHRRLRELPLRGKTLILALSGGADSTALLLILQNLQGALGYELKAAHCHHGQGNNVGFRNESEIFVRELCAKLRIPLQILRNLHPELNSEEELRNFRLESLEQERSRDEALLVFAHHLDDLLETRLIRLIRGTGLQGLEAMRLYLYPVLRPLLGVSRKEIELYLADFQQPFLRDPSREDMRSFIREEWLPRLEERQMGAQQALARSLEVIVASCENLDISGYIDRNGIRSPEFISLSVEQQTQVLAHYMLSLGMRNYSRGMIREILKNLDKIQTVHSFTLAGLRWDIDAKNIRASVL